MPTIKLHKYKGAFKTSAQMGRIFGITADAFNQRLGRGWNYNTNTYTTTYRGRDVQISKPDYYALQGSFMGDSDTAENIYC